jgi:hypothetical protein
MSLLSNDERQPPPGVPEAAPPPDPIRRYWRGRYPVGWSYWAVNVLLGLLLEIAVVWAVHTYDSDATLDPVPQFFWIAGGGIVLAIVFVWLRVGTWRAAARRARERRQSGFATFWPRLAQVMLIWPMLQDLLIVLSAVVIVVEYFPIVFQGDPAIPPYTLRVSADGATITLNGGVRFGLAEDLQAKLTAAPGISRIVLESPGGRIGAAEQVAQVIAAHHLDTSVANECDSMCTRLFVAGKSRTLRPGAKLGFHSGHFTDGGVASAFAGAANDQEIVRYVAAGIDPAFMQRTLKVSSDDIWYPTSDELLAAHVITAGTEPKAASP